MILSAKLLFVSRYDGRFEAVRHHAVAVGLYSSAVEVVLNIYPEDQFFLSYIVYIVILKMPCAPK